MSGQESVSAFNAVTKGLRAAAKRSDAGSIQFWECLYVDGSTFARHPGSLGSDELVVPKEGLELEAKRNAILKGQNIGLSFVQKAHNPRR